ncbi:hypothetical protein LOTGIDRAFT_114368 [Lottia gigantea]|uniref:TEPP protein n=1 Tax=Lottia gigantea TaxID=225164 RepID=V4AM34_LOTGI|nr:hypothetical protein LOTGIDRAFT_114368 [Lottia gigantea]ESO98192.1 hypothetical protein LOTGIDRAFT_114368 [Lottia gigantea]
MTTIGVKHVEKGRIYPKEIPSYSYQYPSFRRVQLAAVKDGLYHPNLPTFRRMDMDTAGNKLPDEHCRTTTSCGPDDFSRATTTIFAPPPKRLSSINITETGRQMHRYYTTPEELKYLKWHTGNNSFCFVSDLHFSGYNVRYSRPDISKSWRYSLRQEPMIDQYGQKPMPANVFARYRDTHPQYNRNISTEAWR